MAMPNAIFHAHDERLEQIDLGWISTSGYDAVQISPMNTSKNGGGAWYDMYQPHKYLELDSRIGNEQDLKEFCGRAHAKGLQVIADVVFNHCQGVAADGGEMFRWYSSGQIEEFYSRLDGPMVPEFSRNDFHGYNPSELDHFKAYLYGDLPSFNFNPYVREIHKKHLDILHNSGVDGLRFDAVKHIPSEVFIDYTNHWRWRKGVGDAFVYGEFWDSNRNAMNRWGHHFTSLTDFPLQNHLAQCFSFSGSLKDLDVQGQAIGVFDVRFGRTHDQPQLNLDDAAFMAAFVNSLKAGASLTLNWDANKKVVQDSIKFRQIMRERESEGRDSSERVLTSFFRTKVSVCVERGGEGFALLNKGGDTIDYQIAEVSESALVGEYRLVGSPANNPFLIEIRHGGNGRKYIERWNKNEENRGGVRVEGRTGMFFERIG